MTIFEVSENVKVGLGMGCAHFDLELPRTFSDRDVRQPVAVVREEIAEEGHGAPVCIASEDVETAKARLAGPADEDPIAAQEEPLTEAFRDEGWSEPLGLYESDRCKAGVIEGVKGESGWEHRSQKMVREGVGEHQAVPEVRDDR